LMAAVHDLLVSDERRDAALAGIDALRHPDAADLIAQRILRLLESRKAA